MKTMHHLLLSIGIGLIALAPAASNASLINDAETVETVGVFVRGLKICHQKEWRDLTVNLEYDADLEGEASDIQAVKGHIRAFLEDYSNPDDFWEVLNKNLVQNLAKSFPDIITMKSTLSIAPDQTLHFPRESQVRYERGANTLKESFNFTKLNYLICQETFRSLNLKVSWDMKENLNPAIDYPDYQLVDNAMESFFKEHPVSFTKWQSLKPELENYLLEKFPSITTVTVSVTVAQ